MFQIRVLLDSQLRLCPSPRRYRARQKNKSIMSIERKKEVCKVILSIIVELLPTVDKGAAEKLACKLSSLRTIQQCISSNANRGDEYLKQTLRRISRKILNRNKCERKPKFSSGASSETTEPLLKSKTDERAESMSMEQSVSLAASVRKACHRTLKDHLGDVKYKCLMSVTQEIKDIRNTSAVWTKFSRDFNKICTIRSVEGLPFEERAPASETVPKPIFDLYFRTQLIDAIQILNPKRVVDSVQDTSDNVLRIDWDGLLIDAKRKLFAYREFEKENILPSDSLNFKCDGHVCCPSLSRRES